MFISFGEINKKWILFLIVPSLFSLRLFLETNMKKKSKNLFFSGFIRFFARSLNSIMWIILYRSILLKNKKQEIISIGKEDIQQNKPKENKSQYEIEREKDLQKQQNFMGMQKLSKLNSIIILIIDIIFDYLSCSLSLLFLELDIMQNISRGLVILSICIRLIFFAVFSYIFIKSMKNYRHHYISAAVIGIVATLVFLSSLINDKDGNKDFWKKFLFKLIPDICFSLAYTLGLKYLIKNSGNIYELLALCGIFEMIISITLQLIMGFKKCKNNYFKKDFEYCDEDGNHKTILFNLKSFSNFGGLTTIILIFINFLEKLSEYLLIYNFSLNHYGAIYAIPTYFQSFPNDKNIFEKIAYVMGGIVILFMIFVYNEMIILKFCGLDENIRSEIMKRADIDILSQKKDEKLSVDDEEDSSFSK